MGQQDHHKMHGEHPWERANWQASFARPIGGNAKKKEVGVSIMPLCRSNQKVNNGLITIIVSYSYYSLSACSK